MGGPRAQRVRAGAAARAPRRARSRRWASACSTTSAIAAEAARRAGAARVLIVDWDVHHGNGTQDIFAARDDVLYMSVHQYPFYPGTGAAARGRRRRGPRRHRQLPAARRPGRRRLRRRVPRSVPARRRAPSRPTWCSCRPASTRTRAIRSPACASRERGFAAMASVLAAARRRDLRRQAGADAGGRLRPGGAGGVRARDAGGAGRAPRGLPAPAPRTRRRWTASARRATALARGGTRGAEDLMSETPHPALSPPSGEGGRSGGPSP